MYKRYLPAGPGKRIRSKRVRTIASFPRTGCWSSSSRSFRSTIVPVNWSADTPGAERKRTATDCFKAGGVAWERKNTPRTFFQGKVRLPKPASSTTPWASAWRSGAEHLVARGQPDFVKLRRSGRSPRRCGFRGHLQRVKPHPARALEGKTARCETSIGRDGLGGNEVIINKNPRLRAVPIELNHMPPGTGLELENMIPITIMGAELKRYRHARLLRLENKIDPGNSSGLWARIEKKERGAVGRLWFLHGRDRQTHLVGRGIHQ